MHLAGDPLALHLDGQVPELSLQSSVLDRDRRLVRQGRERLDVVDVERAGLRQPIASSPVVSRPRWSGATRRLTRSSAGTDRASSSRSSPAWRTLRTSDPRACLTQSLDWTRRVR